MTIHVKTGISGQMQFAGLSQNIIVFHQQVAAAYIGDTGVIVIHIRQRYRLPSGAVKRQIASACHAGAEICGITGFTVRIQDQCIVSGGQQFDLRQTIANIQSIIVFPSGEAIIIRSVRNNLSILADAGFNPIADDIAIAISQRQITRTAGDGSI